MCEIRGRMDPVEPEHECECGAEYNTLAGLHACAVACRDTRSAHYRH